MLKSLIGSALLATAVLAAPAHAENVTVVPDGTWYQFDVDANFDDSLGFIDIVGDALSFTFTTTTTSVLTIVDTGFSGDRYELFDNGNSLGLTSAAVNDPDSNIGFDTFDAALANGNYSRAFFELAAGTHTITGRLSQSVIDPLVGALNASSGGLRVAPVPLPAPLLLLLSGGGVLAFFGRKRKDSELALFGRKRKEWELALFGRKRNVAALAVVERKRKVAALAVVGPKRNIVALAFIGLVAGTAQAATTTVKVIAFNDFHGNLQSPGSLSGTPVGGVDVMATYVANLKAQNPNSVVVSAGDLIGASPLISALFHDEGTIETMNRLGLDFNAVGNHEFDDGRAELLRMQNGGCHPTDASSCEGATVGTPVPFEGAKFKFLSANVADSTTGKTLFAPYGIKQLGGVRIGFIGLTLKETPTIVTPAGVAGLTFSDEAATVNKLVPQLRARGVEAIVVLIHQGGFQGAAPNFINDCSAALQNDTASPIRAIVRKLDNAVDLVVSGHTHTGYNCVLPNAAGRNIPVTQASAFGRVLTDINLTIDTSTGDVTGATVNNILTDTRTVTGNAEVASIVAGYSSLVSPLAASVIGTIAGPVTNGANAAGEMEAGKLIADSQLAATQPAQFGGAVVAFMNAGGVRNPGFVGSAYPHDVTYGEAFTVQPFGNSLVTLTLTGAQLRDLLEQQFQGCLGQTVTRIMQVSSTLVYSYAPNNACGSRIVDATLSGTPIISNGATLNPTQTYRVTVNNFMSTGGDGFAVLTGATDLLGGAQDIDALIAYLASFKVPNAPYDPATVPNRITRLP